MSSSIFFKFKSQKEPSPITFDGTSLSVFEVKREIIVYNKLGDGTDFDLQIYSADTNEVYEDDTVQIPRSTTVIARRLPATKPGAGRAARYVSGKMPVTAKNQHRIENMHNTGSSSTPIPQVAVSSKPLSEEEKLAAMFSESKAALQEASAEIAAKGVNNRPFFPTKTNVAAPDKPVPDGYICHRCGQKGHWIQACPTNNDPQFDGRPKFRRTTGIPRSFLQKVEKPDAVDEDGKIDVSKLPAGVMYTPEGEWVVSRPDEASWQKFQDKTKATAEQQKLAADELEEVQERGLLCPLSNTLFDDPVSTPCCNTTYSRALIENELMDNDFACPNCGEQVLLDDLKTEEDTNKKVQEYKEEKANRVNADAGTPTVAVIDSKSPAGELPIEVQSPSPTPSKKRAAEDDDIEKGKTNGAKMQKSSSKDGTPTKAAVAAQPAVQVPKNTTDFVNQMNQMFGSMPGVQMPGMATGMPGFNPMMMNPMMMQQQMQQMMAVGMMPNMMPGMPPMPPMPPMPTNGQGNGWQSNQAFNNNQQTGNGGSNGAYFRQPVNGHRHRGRQNRPRSMDYKQL